MTTRLILAACAVLSGCTVGGLTASGVGSPDGSTASADSPSAGQDAHVTPLDSHGATMLDAMACQDQVKNPSTDGHHNAGQDCQNGCHDHGFVVSGTLYSSTTGQAVSGGTVTVTDANGLTQQLVSATNGNFYSAVALQFPMTVVASECPSITPMTAQLQTGQGGCNQSGCHVAGAQGHVHP